MRCRILKGIHGFTAPDGTKFTAMPGEEIDLTPEQYSRLGPRRALCMDAAAGPPGKEAPPLPPPPLPLLLPPQEPDDEKTEPPAAPAALGSAADGQGRWADLLKLKSNRLKDAIGKLGSVEEIESLVAEEEAGRNRIGIKMFARERIKAMKG